LRPLLKETDRRTLPSLRRKPASYDRIGRPH
jgi:hypothetical protein